MCKEDCKHNIYKKIEDLDEIFMRWIFCLQFFFLSYILYSHLRNSGNVGKFVGVCSMLANIYEEARIETKMLRKIAKRSRTDHELYSYVDILSFNLRIIFACCLGWTAETRGEPQHTTTIS